MLAGLLNSLWRNSSILGSITLHLRRVLVYGCTGIFRCDSYAVQFYWAGEYQRSSVGPRLWMPPLTKIIFVGILVADGQDLTLCDYPVQVKTDMVSAVNPKFTMLILQITFPCIKAWGGLRGRERLCYIVVGSGFYLPQEKKALKASKSSQKLKARTFAESLSISCAHLSWLIRYSSEVWCCTVAEFGQVSFGSGISF